jgi:hypothetical protein
MTYKTKHFVSFGLWPKVRLYWFWRTTRKVICVENKITFSHNCAIRGAVRKYAMDFCLKKIPSYICATSQCALVLISFCSGKTSRYLYSLPFPPTCLQKENLWMLVSKSRSIHVIKIYTVYVTWCSLPFTSGTYFLWSRYVCTLHCRVNFNIHNIS